MHYYQRRSLLVARVEVGREGPPTFPGQVLGTRPKNSEIDATVESQVSKGARPGAPGATRVVPILAQGWSNPRNRLGTGSWNPTLRKPRNVGHLAFVSTGLDDQSPVPVKLAVCGLLLALSLTLSCPVLLPA